MNFVASSDAGTYSFSLQVSASLYPRLATLTFMFHTCSCPLVVSLLAYDSSVHSSMGYHTEA